MAEERTWTVRDLLAWAGPWLTKHGLDDNPRLDGELLLAKALGLRRLDLFLDPDRPLIPAELATFKGLIKRRAAREPVAYITGQREFWKSSFAVTPAVLIPRPDTEKLVELVLSRYPLRDHPLEILELGVGSGVVLASLLLEYPGGRGVGVDCSEAALAVARRNFATLGLDSRALLRQGNWFGVLDPGERFDVIVANPPYVADGEWQELQPEIRLWEPKEALLAGPDGLNAYRTLLPGSGPWLKPDGMLAVEIGTTQGEAVSDLMRQARYQEVAVHRDYSGHPRVVTGRGGG
ncbi:MAG: peptide chain release factor N(5)-glutamine methyltransferase [Magnetococcales bacterium]|nr:peptide chain release factor N(5)-glutamine methyltransferase [Magnetococcales bacterium]